MSNLHTEKLQKLLAQRKSLDAQIAALRPIVKREIVLQKKTAILTAIKNAGLAELEDEQLTRVLEQMKQGTR